MLKVGSTVMKDYAWKNLLKPRHVKKHTDGLIHIHDGDFLALCINCLYIPLRKLLDNGFSTGHGYLRSPTSINAASSLTCIAIQSSQNDFFGGQAIPLLDYDLAPYVGMSYVRNLFTAIGDYLWDHEDIDLDKFTEDYKKLCKSSIDPYLKKHRTIMDDEGHTFLTESIVKFLLDQDIILSLSKVYKLEDLARRKTETQTFQAMEAMVHNLNTMQSRAGSQTPFSSVNFGTDTSWEGRLVSKCTMQAFDKGLGKGETAIFPIAIFRMKKGITDKGSPNYDLFKMSCEVSAKRLFPNWVNVDAPYNLKYYKPEDPRTQIAAMGATAKGMVALTIYDTKGEVVQTFIDDISLAGEVLLLYPDVIKNQDGSKTYQVFDEHTFYLELDPNRVKIADSYSGTRKWVGVKKFMFWADPHAKWIRFTYRYQTESETGLKLTADFSEKKETESPDSLCDKEFSRRRKNFDMELIVTEDHPLSVYDWYLKKYIRTEAEDIRLGVQLHPTNPNAVEAVWVSDRDEYHPNGTLVGYDFETESDHFDLDYIVSHNCRTRVISNVYDPKHEICYGRGNLFWTTLNLPYIALEVKESLEKITYPDGYSKPLLIDAFFKRLDQEIDDILDFSRDRLRIISKRKAFNYPFAMGQHEYVDSEKLNLNDSIEEVIKQGTISVGFIGLAETLIALIGKHHGESEEAQELGLKIVSFMRARMDQESKNTNMNYSLMATPAEGCTGRLCKLIAKRFGIIPGITDKKYLVNSSHVPPKFHISVADKIRIEAPYHELENAGHIFYCEQDADISKNPEALEDIVTMAADAGCGYIAVNHPVTRDPVCGYVGPLNPDGTCPRCGRKEYEGVTARKLLNLTAYSPDPEYAVTSEKLEDEDKTINDL